MRENRRWELRLDTIYFGADMRRESAHAALNQMHE